VFDVSERKMSHRLATINLLKSSVSLRTTRFNIQKILLLLASR